MVLAVVAGLVWQKVLVWLVTVLVLVGAASSASDVGMTSHIWWGRGVVV